MDLSPSYNAVSGWHASCTSLLQQSLRQLNSGDNSMKNMTAVALVALVTVVCMTAAGEVQAKDKWGININS